MLQVKLKDKLSGNKFFIVSDDVRNESCEKWTEFCFPFKGGSKGSKIMVTTRNCSVSLQLPKNLVKSILMTYTQSHFSKKGIAFLRPGWPSLGLRPGGHMSCWAKCEPILELLKDECTNAKFSVEYIQGMDGLGKTTLAQLIYNDASVKDHFDIMALIYVFENFNVTQVIKTILHSMDPKTGDFNNLNMLQVKLNEK
ncbi:hypothetical protein Dsin_010746, partial [Dipteronia sinensis]